MLTLFGKDGSHAYVGFPVHAQNIDERITRFLHIWDQTQSFLVQRQNNFPEWSFIYLSNDWVSAFLEDTEISQISSLTCSVLDTIQIMNFLFLKCCSSFLLHHQLGVCGFSEMSKKHSSARHQWNVHLRNWNYSIYEFFREFGYKKHSSIAASNLFLFMFPIYSPFGQEFLHLGL